MRSEYTHDRDSILVANEGYQIIKKETEFFDE